jgi:D-alanyl-D-alanine carboxypeptidase
MKNILLTAALFLVSVCAASAKQYTVTFVKPVQVGSVKLAAGEYKVKVDGNNAVFTDSQKKTFTAPAKVQKLEKKTPYTAAETKDVDGGTRVDAIDLEGADFKIVF